MVLDIAQHLSNLTLHNIKKGTRKHQRYVCMARRYTGHAELEDKLIRPPPPIVVLNPEEDPNQEDPHQEDPNQENPHQEDPNQEDSNKEDNNNYFEEDPEEENYYEEDPEDEDYNSKSKPSLNEFFTAAKPTNNRHRWLVKFFEFLTRPTSGDKKKSIRLQHANQMQTLLEAVDHEGDDILCLLDHQGDAVWKLWVKPHLEAKTKKPGTVISYLTSFQKFLEFVTHDRFNKTALPIHPDYIIHFKTLLKDIKGWRSTVDSQSYDVKNHRMVQESEGLLMLEELAKIKSSKAYSEAERLQYKLVKAGRSPSKSFFSPRKATKQRFFFIIYALY